VVLLDTPFSFYIKTSRARLLLSTSYFEVKVVLRFSSVTLCACICLLQIVTYTALLTILADVLARLETPRPRCARSDDESTCLW
jgi:hypothetical protein